MKFSVAYPILLYIVLLLPVTVNNLLKKLHIVNKLHWCLFTMYSKNLSATNSIMTRQFFLMIGSLEVTHELIGSLEVTHELIFIIPSVIQISSINSIRLRLILGKPQLTCTPLDVNLHPVFKKIKTYCILPYRHYVFLALPFKGSISIRIKYKARGCKWNIVESAFHTEIIRNF